LKQKLRFDNHEGIVPLMELRDLIRTVAQNDGEHDTVKTVNGRRIGMKAERQIPTIKTGTRIKFYSGASVCAEVTEISRSGVALLLGDELIELSFDEVERAAEKGILDSVALVHTVRNCGLI